MARRGGLSRRDFIKLAGLSTGAALVGACAPAVVAAQRDSGMPAPVAATWTPFSTRTPHIQSPTPELIGTPVSTIPTPTANPMYAGRKLCFVLWDHQLAKYGYRSRDLYNPVPETCPLYSASSNPMTPDWIAYWKGILRLCNPDVSDVHFQHAWESLVDSHRAFTNGTGPETGDFRISSLTCGGATHEMVTGEPEGLYMRIYTLNWAKGPPPIPPRPEQIDMTRHFFATTGSNVRLADGSYAVYGFPQFENCIVPLISQANTDRILTARIKPVAAIQKPYNP